jgi:nucleotide-binding universal stress UspA family protein
MNKLLVPTDFSDNARNALPYVIDIANLFGAEITLLHTYRVYSTTGMFISVESYLKEDAAREMLQLVRYIERRLENGASIETRIIRGDAVPIITKVAEKDAFDLIIMGTQGASGLKEIFLGSVTNGVSQQTQTPLLAIPSDFSYRPIEKIVWAIDEQGVSYAKVVAPLIKLAKKLDARLAVYHKDTGSADRGIDPTVEIFLEGIDYSFHYELDTDNINESINAFVADYRADLLCMIKRKLGLLEKIFHSSHTSKEVFDSPVPLLILHDPD